MMLSAQARYAVIKKSSDNGHDAERAGRHAPIMISVNNVHDADRPGAPCGNNDFR